MKTVGIICEYNPLHLGHLSQIRRIREDFGDACAIVCAMSGNFVQRGAPAILDKSLRAEAAVLCGADLVLELPVTTSLSSAEGFASGGVRILSQVCDGLSFGAEEPRAELFLSAAQALLDSRFPSLLRRELAKGCSFPAARQAALASMGAPDHLLTQPNNILAVEYCKAILTQGVSMKPLPIRRQGDYHARTPQPGAPSATAVRRLMLAGEAWDSWVPGPAAAVFRDAPVHTTAAGERAVLARLRTMTDEEFAALPYGSEGLWRRLMHASRRERTLEDILTAVKSKRYTRSRLDRMVICAFLGITEEAMQAPAPYARILAFNRRGRTVLSTVKEAEVFLNAGAPSGDPFRDLEYRCADLYGLFCVSGPEPPGAEARRRVRYVADLP